MHLLSLFRFANVAFFTVSSLICSSWFGSVSEASQSWDSVVGDPSQKPLFDAHKAKLDVFVWPISINKDEEPTIYVRSPAPFKLRVYRLGWYSGAGASIVYDNSTLYSARNMGKLCGAQSNNGAVASGQRDFGIVECAWSDPISPAIPEMTSGLYLAIVTTNLADVELNNAAVFVVRDDSSSAQLVIVNPTTAQAYSVWSDTPDSDYATGYVPLSFYAQSTAEKFWPRATKVSFNRPMYVFDFLKTDYPLIRFLEREGIAYTLSTDFDLHNFGANVLANRRSVVISGHGEYWSFQTRSSLDQFVARGGNIVAMTSNTGYWQIRYESSPAGLPGPAIVSYKESALDTRPADQCQDIVIPAWSTSCGDPFFFDSNPSNDRLVTTLFRDPPVNKPEQLLFGVQYQLDPGSNGFELPIELDSNTIASLSSIGQGISPVGNQIVGALSSDGEFVGNMGWEVDVVHPHVLLQMSPSACLRQIGTTQWPWENTSVDHIAHAVLYKPTSTSGYVFGGLTMLWSWGLDEWATINRFGGPVISRVNSSLQTLTRNMLQAADSGNFGNDCTTAFSMSYFFANIIDGKALIIKENDNPGRWSIVPLQQDGGSLYLRPDSHATATLTGWALASGAYDLFMADVNGDGLTDLIAKEKLMPGYWYVALGDGVSFYPEPNSWLGGWAVASDAYNLFVADVNGDAKSDLIAKEKNPPGNWYVALSSGSSFQPAAQLWLDGWAVASGAYDLLVADVNGDGKSDLIAKEKNPPGNWYAALSSGSSFQPSAQLWLNGWAVDSSAYNLFLADVNGDRKADLIAKEKNVPGNWYVALSDGSSFQPEANVWLNGWAVASGAYDLFVTDVNGDQLADLVAKEINGPRNWYVALSTGESFSPQQNPMLSH